MTGVHSGVFGTVGVFLTAVPIPLPHSHRSSPDFYGLLVRGVQMQ